MWAKCLIRKDRSLLLEVLILLYFTLLPLVVICTSPEFGNWPLDYGNKALEPGGLSNFDFVVIGSGWAGSILAKRLSEHTEWRVLVLELSGNVTFSTEPSTKSCLTKIYRSCQWPRDNNASISRRYIRGNSVDYKNWSDEGNNGWDWDTISDYFLSVQQSTDLSDSSPIEYVNLISPKALGNNLNGVKEFIRNTRENLQFLNIPAYSVQESIPTVSMKNSEEIGARSNLFVIRNVEVQRINLDRYGKRVTSVTFALGNNRDLEVKAKKEVVLSAGAIDSAKILMLSGIGTRSHLENIGIRVRKDLPVGQNLQGHPTLPLFIQIPEWSVHETVRNDSIITNGELPLFELFDSTYNFTRADIEFKYFFIERNDLEGLNNWSTSLGLSNFYKNNLQTKVSVNKLVVNLVLIQPESKGTVELRSADYTDAPKIKTNCLETQEDIQKMLRGIRLLQYRINMNQTANYRLWKVPIPACYHYGENSDEYWECYIRTFVTSTFDLVGSVKMGASAGSSCVDSRLLIHGIANLRVADESIIPKIPMVETTAATMMIAERAADIIKKDWSHSLKSFQINYCPHSGNNPKFCRTS